MLHTAPNARAKSGLEATFLANKERLVRFLRMRGSGEQAEDLVQEVWFKVTSNPIGPIANPESYLFRVAHNLMIDWHRSERQRSFREQDWADIERSGSGEADGTPNAEQTILARSVLERVSAEIDGLGEPTNSIFKQFRIEGRPQKDIASGLGVSLATVEKHLQKAYRAMSALRREIDDTGIAL